MPGLRDILAGLMTSGRPSSQPLSFEELLRQERGDRDTAAKRFNAQSGGPVSSAYSPPAPAAPVAPAAPAAPAAPVAPAAPAAPDPMQTAALALPAEAPIPPPRPDQILEDRATRERPQNLVRPEGPVGALPASRFPMEAPIPPPRPSLLPAEAPIPPSRPKQARKKKKRSQYRLES